MKHEPQPPQTTIPVTVTNVTDSLDSFAVNEDGETVYVPPSLSARFGLQRDQVRSVKVVPNNPAHAERVPWRAYYVEPLEKGQMELPLDHGPETDGPCDRPDEHKDPEDLVLDKMDDVGVMATGDVAALLGVSSMRARNLLDRMHTAGEVARADVFVDPGQQKASRTLWAQCLADMQGRWT